LENRTWRGESVATLSRLLSEWPPWLAGHPHGARAGAEDATPRVTLAPEREFLGAFRSDPAINRMPRELHRE
jgi:hypothetical protein